MKRRQSAVLILFAVAVAVGLTGCGIDKYNWHFGLGTDAADGVTTDTSVDRLKDGVLPPEPETPEKPKKGEEKSDKPAADKAKKPKAP